MKIVLNKGEAAKILLNYLRETGRIPNDLPNDKISRSLSDGGFPDDELVEYTFEVPE